MILTSDSLFCRCSKNENKKVNPIKHYRVTGQTCNCIHLAQEHLGEKKDQNFKGI